MNTVLLKYELLMTRQRPASAVWSLPPSPPRRIFHPPKPAPAPLAAPLQRPADARPAPRATWWTKKARVRSDPESSLDEPRLLRHPQLCGIASPGTIPRD